MAISKITLNGVVQIDLTSDTVTAQTLLDDITAHGADGTSITGEYVAPTPKTADDVIVSGATVTIPAGAYASQVQKSVASGTAGTPTATKGAVNNHSVAVTPSVTNTTGYITGSTKTGTAVTVTASELASGNKSITQNGENIDVVGYSTVSVDVASGGATNLVTGTFTTVDTAGGKTTVTIDYTGSGYIVAGLIFVSGGMYNAENTDWYGVVDQYSIGAFSFQKNEYTTSPDYYTSAATRNMAYLIRTYKSSSSDGNAYSTDSASTTGVYVSAQPTAAIPVRITSRTGFRTINRSSPSTGFKPSTEYTYIFLYSE